MNVFFPRVVFPFCFYSRFFASSERVTALTLISQCLLSLSLFLTSHYPHRHILLPHRYQYHCQTFLCTTANSYGGLWLSHAFAIGVITQSSQRLRAFHSRPPLPTHPILLSGWFFCPLHMIFRISKGKFLNSLEVDRDSLGLILQWQDFRGASGYRWINGPMMPFQTAMPLNYDLAPMPSSYSPYGVASYACFRQPYAYQYHYHQPPPPSQVMIHSFESKPFSVNLLIGWV